MAFWISRTAPEFAAAIGTLASNPHHHLTFAFRAELSRVMQQFTHCRVKSGVCGFYHLGQPGPNGKGGSPWALLGDMLVKKYEVPVGFICVGVGGTRISKWLPPRGHYVRIRAALQSRLQQLQTECFPIACYEAPLLIEVGCQDSYRPLVVVSATEELQLIRAQQRDSSQETALRARIAAQLPLATKAAAADYVIQNTGSRQALIREADRVLDAVCRRVGVNPSALKPT